MNRSTEKFLTGRTAWVTGASRGIGRVIAMTLARAGATVVLGARSTDALETVAETIRNGGGTAHAVTLDVASAESVSAFNAAAVAAAGPPAILVNNAGTGLFRDFKDMTPEDFNRQIDVNLRGPWLLAHEAEPHMRRLGEGWIINISSIAGRVPFKRGTAYCAAKAGLNAMSEALMLELREHHIRVVTIAPGSVDSAFHRGALPSAHHNDQTWMLEPEAIADAVLHVLRAPDNALVNYYEVRPLLTKG